MRGLLVLICALIVYGSLFPFQFAGADVAAALREILNGGAERTGPGDILGNIALFMPLGFFGMIVLARAWPLPMAFAIVAVAGIILAGACQVAQIYLPMREASIIDVAWNAVGIAVGVAPTFSSHVRNLLESTAARVSISVPASLIGLWLAAQLVPFVPAIDFEAYKDALKPLLLYPRVDWPQALFHTAAWLTIARFAAALAGARWHAMFLPVGIAVVLAVKVVIVTRTLGLSSVIGACSAVALWHVGRDMWQRHGLVLAFGLLLAFAILGLDPFTFNAETARFEWIPFGGFLHGSMLINTQAFFEKLFVLGGVFWLLREAGWRTGAIVLVSATMAFVEVGQIWIPGHVPEITDVLLALAIGLAAVRLTPAAQIELPPGSAAADRPAAPHETSDFTADRRAAVLAYGAWVYRRWAGLGARAMTGHGAAGELKTAPVIVALSPGQAEFLDALAARLDQTRSETVAAILEECERDMAGSRTAENAILAGWRAPEAGSDKSAADTRYAVHLPDAQKRFVARLIAGTGLDSALVIRCLIARFIANCAAE